MNLTRWLFLRLLGGVFLVAFLSLWVQIAGLVGSRGLLPAGEFLDRAREQIGSEAYWRLPTLCWLSHSDATLAALCAAGVVLAGLLIVGVAPRLMLAAMWALYLSLTVAGQTFLNFQWDILLLEAGFTSIFFAPPGLRPRWPRNEPPPSPSGLWLVRLLLFKLMFLSGIVKLLSMDATWWELRALDYHYFTQPLPTWTAWYMHQLPGGFRRLCVLIMFVIELGAPCLIFAGRRLRALGAAALVVLQALIAATGNYNFFNLLSVVLCLPLLDDGLLTGWLPKSLRRKLGPAGDPVGPPARRMAEWALGTVLAAAVLLTSGLTFVREMVGTVSRQKSDRAAGTLVDHLLYWGDRAVLRWTDPFRTISGYGLFRAMTTERLEIIVEGTADGRSWREYEFRWKPGDVTHAPRFVAPHQPRLDWQMWFAALAPSRHEYWLQALMLRLLEGEPQILRLLGANPFADAPPRQVRLVYYKYRFTTREERARTGAWWSRERTGYLTAPLGLESFRR